MEDELFEICSYIDHPKYGCCQVIDVNTDKKYYKILTHDGYEHSLKFSTKVERRADGRYKTSYDIRKDKISVTCYKLDEDSEKSIEPFSVELFNELYEKRLHDNEERIFMTCKVEIVGKEVFINEKYRTRTVRESAIRARFNFMDRAFYEFVKEKDVDDLYELIDTGIKYINCDKDLFQREVRRKYGKDIFGNE